MTGGASLPAVVTAIAPIFLLIVLGCALRRRQFVPDAFWRSAESMTYYVFFPCLLFMNLARADLDWVAVLPMVASLSGAVLLTALGCRLIRPLWGPPGPAYTSVFQGAIRANSYVGLAAAFSLYGEEGLTLAAIGIAAVVPVVNVLSVLVLARHGRPTEGASGGIARQLATNPLIIAVVSGIAWNVLSLPVPPVIGPTMDILASASLPIGLMAVGAGLSLADARRDSARIGVSVAGKLLVVPLLTLGLCLLLGVDGLATTMAVLYNANPAAASAYVLARQMGGDAPLMAGIITASTLAAAITIPALLLLIGAISGCA